MTALLHKIQNLGVHDGLDSFDVKRVRLLNSLCVLGLSACLAVVPWVFIQDNLNGLWGNLLSQGAIGGVCWLQHRRRYRAAAVVLSLVGLVGVPLQMVIFPETWGIHFWLLPLSLLPQVIFFRDDRHIAVALGWAMFIAFTVCVLHAGAKTSQEAPEMAAQILAAITLMLIGGAVRTSVHEAEQEALDQADKAEAILRMTLPRAAVEQLKRGQQPPFEVSNDDCTVMMADIVGFTQMAETIRPQELIRILDEIFHEYDRLAEGRGLEKIKTMGDGYMIAAGAPDPYPGHEDAIAGLALDLVAITRELGKRFDLPLEVRIGIHSGVAWGGVIGQTRIAYDIWGDTVNMAARMEQHGLPGRIQLSQETAERLSPHFSIEARGMIAVKNKGEVHTYFLNGVVEEPASAHTEAAS